MEKPKTNLLRALLDACDEDGSLDETRGRAIEREHMQLTIDGREVTTHSLPAVPVTEGEQGPQSGKPQRLFPAPQTILGQPPLDTR